MNYLNSEWGTENECYLEPLVSQPSARLGKRQTGVEPMTHHSEMTDSRSIAGPDSSTETLSTGRFQPEPYRSPLLESEVG